MSIQARRTRHALLLSTALIGLSAAPVVAQTVPVPATAPDPVTGLVPGGASITTPTPGSVEVDLRDRNRVIRWTSFSLGSETSSTETIRFSTADQTTRLAALNLVTTSAPSRIYGQISAQPNITVWLSNPAGILVGPTGGFSGGSLVLTTAGLSTTEIEKFNGENAQNGAAATVALTAAPSNVGVVAEAGSRFGGSDAPMGALLIAGQQVAFNGQVNASGDVAMIAAEDANVPFQLASPIRVAITKGTDLGRLNIGAEATVNGASVVLGGAIKSGTELLLGVEAGAALTATAVNGTVVIAAGTPSLDAVNSAERVAVADGGLAGVAIAGTVRAVDDVAIRANGDALVTGDLTAGSPTNPGNIIVDAGRSLTLGRSDTQRMTASVDVSLAARDGSIGLVPDGRARILAGSIPNAFGSIYLDQSVGAANPDAATAGIRLAGADLVAGFSDGTSGPSATRIGDVFVRAVSGDLALGEVDARSFNLPADPDSGERFLAGMLTALRITTNDTLDLRTTNRSIRLGTAESLTGNVSLLAELGDITGIANGAADLFARAGGAGVTVSAGGLVQLGTVTAGASSPSLPDRSGTQISVTAGSSDRAGTIIAQTLNATERGLFVKSVGGSVLMLDGTAAGAARVEADTGAAIGTLSSANGFGLTMRAGGDVTGVDRGAMVAGLVATATGLRLNQAIGLAGAVDVEAAGDARIGALATTGALRVLANGSITGLSAADVATGSGGTVLTAVGGGSISIGGTPAGDPLARASSAAIAGATTDGAGAIEIRADVIAAGTLPPGGATASGLSAGGLLTLDADTGLSVDLIAAADGGRITTASGGIAAPGGVAADEGPFAADFDRAALSAGLTLTVAGRDPGVVPELAQLGLVTAGALGTATPGTSQLTVTARRIDATTLRADRGDLVVDARAEPGLLRLGLGEATLGDVTVDSVDARIEAIVAGRDASLRARDRLTGRGPLPALAADEALRLGLADAGAITLRGAGDVKLGDLNAAALIDVDAQGSVFGTAASLGQTGTAITGRVIRVGGATGATLGQVALGAVRAGEAVYLGAGDPEARVGAVANATIGSIEGRAGSAPIINAQTSGGRLSIDRIGAEGRVGSVYLSTAAAGTVRDAPLYSGSDSFGLSDQRGTLRATGDVRVRAATSGVVELDLVSGTDVSLAGAAVAVSRSATATGMLDVTARIGGLYLGDARAGEDAILRKMGDADIAFNEVRLGLAGTNAGLVGRSVLIESARDLRARRIAGTTGDVTLRADHDISGLVDGSADDRLLGGYGRLDLVADAAASRTAVTAGGTTQLGNVTAGSGDERDAGLNQIVVRAARIDLASGDGQRAVAVNGNLSLTATDPGVVSPAIRVGDAAAGAGIQFFNAVDGTYRAGLDTFGDARIGRLTAGVPGSDGIVATTGNSDILLRVNGVLSGLGGSDPDGVAVGLSLGSVALTGGLDVVAGGDAFAGALNADDVRMRAGGNLRVGTVAARGLATLTAARSVTGLGGAVAAPASGANLIADAGTVRLPASVGEQRGRAAILGEVRGGTVTIAADRVSAGSIRANMTTVAAGDRLSVGTLAGGTAMLTSAAGAVEAADPRLATDARSGGDFARLDDRFGDARIAAGGEVNVVAGAADDLVGVAQLGLVSSTGAAVTATADALTVRGPGLVPGAAAADAAGGALMLTAREGGLYLASGRAATDALLTKNGAAIASGDDERAVEMRLGTLDAGANTILFSNSNIRGSSVTAGGEAVLRAVGLVGGLPAGEGATASGIRLGGASVGGALGIGSAGEVRVGGARSGTSTRVESGGSTTGLLLDESIPAASFSVIAGRSVDVGGRDDATLGAATLVQAVAQTGSVSIEAGRVTVGAVSAGTTATLLAGSGLWTGSLNTSGDALLRASGPIDIDTVDLAVADNPENDPRPNEALAPTYGFADFVAGTDLRVDAGLVAQLGRVVAGANLTLDAAAITVTTAISGDALGLTARAGGLYLGNGLAGGSATLVKNGAAAGIGNELRTSTLLSTGTTTLVSATDVRLGSATSRAGDVSVEARKSVTGLLRLSPDTSGDGRMLQAYSGANLTAIGEGASFPIVRVTAGDDVKLDGVAAGQGDAAGTFDQIDVTGRSIDALTVRAFNGDLRLTTATGRLRLGAGDARGSALLVAGTDAGSVADAQLGNILAREGNLALRASGAVSGLLADGIAAQSARDGLRITALDAGQGARSGVVSLSGAGDVRLGTIEATGLLGADAGGSITGLATDEAVGVTGARLVAGGDVSVRAGEGQARMVQAALELVQAGATVDQNGQVTGIDRAGSIDVDASILAAGLVRAGADVDLRAGAGLTADRIDAALVAVGRATVITDQAGTIAAIPDRSTALWLSDGFGAANLSGRAVEGGVPIDGRVVVTAARAVQLGTVQAQGRVDGTRADANAVVQITGRALSVDVARSADTLRLTARDGALHLGTGTAASDAYLTKNGSIEELRVGSTAAEIPGLPQDMTAGALVAGGSILARSDTSIRAQSFRAQRGDVLLRADQEVTGLQYVAPIDELQIGTGTGLNIGVTGGGDVRLGRLDAGGAISVGAVGSVTGPGAVTGSSSLLIEAAGGVDVRGRSARLGLAAINRVAAGALPSFVEAPGASEPTLAVATDPLAAAIRIDAERTSLGTVMARSGAVRLSAGRALSIGTITAAGDIVATTESGPVAPVTLWVADKSLGANEDPVDTLLPAFGFAQLTAGNAVTVAAGAVAQLGTLTGSTVTVNAEAITVARNSATDSSAATARNGALALTARSGGLYLESGSAGTDAFLTKSGAGGTQDERVRANTLRVGRLDAGGRITLSSDTALRARLLAARNAINAIGTELGVTARAGDNTGLRVVTPDQGATVADYGRATMTASGDGARIAVIAPLGRIQAGTISAGIDSGARLTGDQISINAQAIDVTSAIARNAGMTATSTAGEVRLGTGAARAGATVAAAGSGRIGTLTAGDDATVISVAGDVTGLQRVDRPATLADYGRADVTATQDTRVTSVAGVQQLGTVTGGRNTTLAGRGVNVTTATATAGTLDVAATAGDAILGTGRAGTDVTIVASGFAGADGLSAGRAITVGAGAINVGTATTGGAITATAGSGQLTLGSGDAGTSVTLTKNGDAGDLAIGTGGVRAVGEVQLRSTIDVDVAGVVRSASGSLLVENTRGTGIALGDGASTGFALLGGEVNRLEARTITIDAGAGGLSLTALPLGSNGGNRTLNLLTTGDVAINGALSASGDRTIRIGGSRLANGEPDTVTTSSRLDDIDMAQRITLSLDGAGAISLPAGTVELYGRQILFGDATLREAVGAAGTALDRNVVANSSSPLYRLRGSARAGETYLTAGTLRVRYSDYALFQNTGPNSAVASGIRLALANPAASSSELALDLVSRGDTSANSFALFGEINGLTGSSAALLPEAVISYAGGNPRTVFINQPRSRVNGCVIGAPSAGCLLPPPPPPLLRLFDERQVQLFATSENPELTFEPLIGTSNEALIGDLVTGPAGDARAPGVSATPPERATPSACPDGSDFCPAANPEPRP